MYDCEYLNKSIYTIDGVNDSNKFTVRRTGFEIISEFGSSHGIICSGGFIYIKDKEFSVGACRFILENCPLCGKSHMLNV